MNKYKIEQCKRDIAALEEELKKLQDERPKLCMGQVWRNGESAESCYIVAKGSGGDSNRMFLVGLYSGGRWDSQTVPLNIAEERAESSMDMLVGYPYVNDWSYVGMAADVVKVK